MDTTPCKCDVHTDTVFSGTYTFEWRFPSSSLAADQEEEEKEKH